MLYHYESERLCYDILLPEDADRILQFYEHNKNIFEKYEPDHPANYYTIEYQTSLAKLENENFLRGNGARFWITRKSQPGILIGCISFNNILKGSFLSCTIGYKIHEAHQNLGYATEAVRCLVSQLFMEKSLHRVEAYIHPENAASIALVEKCGFNYEGVAKEYVFMHGRWQDHLRYTLLAD